MNAVFILKRNNAGMRYGMGTYVSELVKVLDSVSNLHIYVVSYNDRNYNFLNVEQVNNHLTKISIPPPCGLNIYVEDARYEKSICLILSEFVELHARVVFHSNYYSELNLVRELKQRFVFPVLAAIHFSQELEYSSPFHENNNEDQSYLLKMEKEYYGLVDKLICLNDSKRNNLMAVHQIPRQKIEVVNNGIAFEEFTSLKLKDKQELKKRYGFNPSDILVLFVGRLEYQKGVFELLPAFREASLSNPRLRLVLAGDGDFSAVLPQNELLGRVIVTGFLPKERMNTLYQIADIGILPSFNEQQPYSVLEMIRAKIPVVLSKIEPLVNLLGNEASVYVNVSDTKKGKDNEMTKAILTLAADKKKSKDLAKKAFSILTKKYDSFQMGKHMDSIYHDIINTIK